jgi:hypothetical protein
MAVTAHGDWDRINLEILQRLNIQEEYEALGVTFTASTPGPKGWLPCQAIGRDDRNPSAAACISGDALGRYRDLGGECLSLSLWDFAAKFGSYIDWKQARSHYADKVGVKVGKATRGKDPADQLEFQAWNEALVAAWCRHKPGVTVEAFRVSGGRLAKTPKCTGERKRKQIPVVVLPVYGPRLTDADPCGWVAWARSGKDLPVSQGKGNPPAWVKMKTVAGSTRGWLGQHGLLHLDEAEVVWKCEGPADMLAIYAAMPPELQGKHVVITNSGGCGEIPHDELIEHLSGKTVYVLHDADKPGQGIPKDANDVDDRHRLSGARLWCREIAKYAREVRNVQLPYPIAESHGKDARDWLNEGHTYAELLSLAEAAAIVRYEPEGRLPSPASGNGSDSASEIGSEPGSEHEDNLAVERLLCDHLRIDVMGEVSNGAIKLFSIHHRKMEVIKDISRWTYEKILQFCGPPAKSHINRGLEPMPGMYTVQQVRDAVAMIAGYRRIGKNVYEVGRGCWRGKSDSGEDNETIVLVGPREAARLNGKADAVRVLTPRIDNLLLDIGEDEKAWYDLGKLNEYLALARDADWTKQVVAELDGLFSRWVWKQPRDAPSNISANVCSGLVLSTWVQTLWRWRPLVSIIGSTNSGKTSLFEMLGGNDRSNQGLFGGLSILSSQSSEAGIRQAIRNTAAVLMCDEFEDSKDRARILNLFRTSGRGAKILRGTASQKSEAFGLQHIAWVAAIGVSLKREPDRNRFITLELDKPSDDQYGKLKVPPEDVLLDLGQRSLAVALIHVRDAVQLAVRLKSTSISGVDKRVIESYSVPAAMMATCLRCDGELVLNQMIKLVEREHQGQSDELELLGDILSARVDCGHGERWSVSQILTSDNKVVDHMEKLESHGVGLFQKKRGGEKVLFVSHKVAVRELLRGTDWSDVDQILSRLPGAKRDKQRLAGTVVNGVSVPYEWFYENVLNKSCSTERVAQEAEF